MTPAKCVTILGLVLDGAGAVYLLRGAMLSKDEARQIGISRLGYGDDRDETLPAVQALIRNAKAARIGAVLLVLGFVFQLVGAALQ